MKECKNDATLLSALKLNELIDINAVINRTNITAARDSAIDAFRKINLTYVFPKQELKKLNVFLLFIYIFFQTFKIF